MERFLTISAPSTLADRLSDTAELLALAAWLGDPAIESRAWFLRFRAAMEAGDIAEADRGLAAAERVTSEWVSPPSPGR